MCYIWFYLTAINWPDSYVSDSTTQTCIDIYHHVNLYILYTISYSLFVSFFLCFFPLFLSFYSFQRRKFETPWIWDPFTYDYVNRLFSWLQQMIPNTDQYLHRSQNKRFINNTQIPGAYRTKIWMCILFSSLYFYHIYIYIYIIYKNVCMYVCMYMYIYHYLLL